MSYVNTILVYEKRLVKRSSVGAKACAFHQQRQVLGLSLEISLQKKISGKTASYRKYGKVWIIPCGCGSKYSTYGGCARVQASSFPMKSLGLPLGANVRDSFIWNPKEGKVTLI